MAKQLVPGNNAISIDEAGWVLFKRPHGTFLRTTDQTIANPAVNTEVIIFDTALDMEGLIWTSVNPSRIYVPTAGSYEIIFSGMCSLATGNNKKIDIWLKIDRTTIAQTNTVVNLIGTTLQTVVASFIYDMDTGQYIELGTWGEETACTWDALTGLTLPDRPDAPSMVVTVKKISSRLSYE